MTLVKGHPYFKNEYNNQFNNIMKSNGIFMALCCAAALAGCNSQKAGVVTGSLEGVECDSLIISVSNTALNRPEWNDTIKIENGKFTYQLNAENARNVTIAPIVPILDKPVDGKRVATTRIGAKRNQINLIMMPGETAEVKGTFSDYTVTGSQYYQDMKSYNETMDAFDKDFAEKRAQLNILKDSLDAETFKQKSKELYDEMMASHWQAILDYIKANPNSNYAYYTAVSIPERREEAAALISDKVKEGPFKEYADAMNEIYRKREEQRKAIAEAAAKLIIGKPAPDFTLNDIKGNPLSLSSLKGKYVVLDFWGSWCGWCIKGIPEMKAYYKKYNSKLEILGIACGDTEEKWKAAVAENQLPWLNVINDKTNNDISKLYAVSGYPTKVVIDPEGNMAKVIVGESPEFYEYLDKLLK